MPPPGVVAVALGGFEVGVHVRRVDPIGPPVEPAGLGEVNVRVDEPRRDEAPPDVDDFGSGRHGAQGGCPDAGEPIALHHDHPIRDGGTPGAVDDRRAGESRRLGCQPGRRERCSEAERGQRRLRVTSPRTKRRRREPDDPVRGVR